MKEECVSGTALVITSEASLGDFLEMLLTEEGFRIERINRIRPDELEGKTNFYFVVLDLDTVLADIQEINGWLKQETKIPVIALEWEKESLDHLDVVPFAFLRKPFDINAFSNTVKSFRY